MKLLRRRPVRSRPSDSSPLVISICVDYNELCSNRCTVILIIVYSRQRYTFFLDDPRSLLCVRLVFIIFLFYISFLYCFSYGRLTKLPGCVNLSFISFVGSRYATTVNRSVRQQLTAVFATFCVFHTLKTSHPCPSSAMVPDGSA